MTTTLRLLIAAGAALALAACSEEPASPEAAAENINQTAELDPSSVAYFQQTVGDRVFFSTDSSQINNLSRQTLIRQAAWLNEPSNAGVNATIEGHADERGTREYNIALGARRAAAVRSFLITQGVAAGRLNTVSFGKERPEAPCSAETCWSQNRRGVTALSGAPLS
ncbi:MAG: peptidoglycan-associated lipoprotein Pal [Pseudomonadota bacterium]